ncbi:MAG: hypothetical protein CMK09_19060 [Ponticaulis sp.]|nr:hypothetical protein [Ponticaulis sp.]|tara:strand:- start:182592 stop:182864 length:273 start_codon:yes stop_codon:yes gene_type:complete
MRNAFRILAALALAAGLVPIAASDSEFSLQAELHALTCGKSTSSTLAKSSICVLENQKLDELFDSLTQPSYEDVAAYHEQSAMTDVLGAG